MKDKRNLIRAKIADESVWLGQNFFDDEVLEKRLSTAAALNHGIKHIAFNTENEALRWLEESSNLSLLYHATFHSIFLKWAVAGNGLHVAADKYKGWKEGQVFRISGYRCDGKAIVPVCLHDYPGTSPPSFIWRHPYSCRVGILQSVLGNRGNAFFAIQALLLSRSSQPTPRRRAKDPQNSISREGERRIIKVSLGNGFYGEIRPMEVEKSL